MGPTSDASSVHRSGRYARLLRIAALVSVVLLLVVACGGNAAVPGGSPRPSNSPQATLTQASPQPRASGDQGQELCRRIAELEQRTETLGAVELKLPNRVALGIELSNLQAAYGKLEEADLGELKDQLETPLRRLGYRLGEVELAVEDFRTNPRPKRATPHVEGDVETFAAELAAFSVLARC